MGQSDPLITIIMQQVLIHGLHNICVWNSTSNDTPNMCTDVHITVPRTGEIAGSSRCTKVIASRQPNAFDREARLPLVLSIYVYWNLQMNAIIHESTPQYLILTNFTFVVIASQCHNVTICTCMHDILTRGRYHHCPHHHYHVRHHLFFYKK